MRLLAALQRNKEQLKVLNLGDLLTIRHHSSDFNGTRAEQINMRLQLIALAFGLMAPFWIPIDYYSLNDEAFSTMVWMRIAFSISMLLIGFSTAQNFSIGDSRIRLALMLLPPGIFYVSSIQILNNSLTSEALLVGYTFFPFLMVVMLTIFPLTMLEGLSYTTLVTLFALAPHLLQGELLSAETLKDLWLLGLLAGICMWPGMAQLHMLLSLYRQASRDPLTRLVNRRILIKQLQCQIRETARDPSRNLAILLMDLDRFKRVNDTYGHLVGDQVLIDFSTLLSDCAGKEDTAGRYGGEEFMVILPHSDAQTALSIANSINQQCRERPIELVSEQFDEPHFNYSVSSGVAQLRAGENELALIERVDDGLYQAKADGRDCVTLMD